MIFEIFFALSLSMPSLRDASMRYSLPEGYGSPSSRDFSEIPRLTSFYWKTSRMALTRSSLLAFSCTASPLQAIDASVPRKS